MKNWGGVATLGELNHEVFKIEECEWKTKTPFASIRRIVQQRKEIYKKAQEIIRHDIPMYMILYPTQAVATQKNIKGFKLGTMNSYEIYEVSIEK